MRQNQREDEMDRRGPAVIVPKIELSDDFVDVCTTLSSRIMLFHGDPKIGKSVQANNATGGSFFLKFEPGHDHMKHRGQVINSWVEAIGTIDALEAKRKARTPIPYSNVCIDTAGMAFLRCTEHILGQLGLLHESDADYGKGSQMIGREFRRQITRLCNLGFGVIMIAHSTDKKFSNGKKGQARQEWTKRVVDLPKKAEEVIPPLADLILYFAKEFDEETDQWIRFIKTQGTDAYSAGARYPDGWAPLPESIPMSYQALEEAWNAGAPEVVAALLEAERLAKEKSERDIAELADAKADYQTLYTLVGAATARVVLGKAPEANVEALRAATAKLKAAHDEALSRQAAQREQSKEERGSARSPSDPPPLADSPPGSAPPSTKPPAPLKVVPEAEEPPQPGPSANQDREAARDSKATDGQPATSNAGSPQIGETVSGFRRRLKKTGYSERQAELDCKAENGGRSIGQLTAVEREELIRIYEKDPLPELPDAPSGEQEARP